MNEILKGLFDENEKLGFDELEKKIQEKGLKLADISKGDYVAKKKYDDDLASSNTKYSELETKYNSLVNAQNTNKTEEQKKQEEFLKQFEALKTSSETTAKELDLYKKKESMRANGIDNERLMNLAMFELKDSKDFDADIKTWAEQNKNLVTPTPPTPPAGGKGKTIPPLGGNPNPNNDTDAFVKGMLKGAGLTDKDVNIE